MAIPKCGPDDAVLFISTSQSMNFFNHAPKNWPKALLIQYYFVPISSKGGILTAKLICMFYYLLKQAKQVPGIEGLFP